MSSVRAKRKAAKRAERTAVRQRAQATDAAEAEPTLVDEPPLVSLEYLDADLDVILEDPPERSRIAFRREVGRGKLVVPGPGVSAGSLALFLFGLSFCSLGTLAVFALSGAMGLPFHGPRAAGWSLGIGFLSVGLTLVVLATALGMIREVVRERGDGLCFSRELGGLGWGRRFLLKRSIEEVSLRPFDRPKGSRGDADPEERSRAIVVCSDDARVRLGERIGEVERRWVARALKFLIRR